ncbi:MAG: response regulator [Terriglobales bacterium]
MAQRATSEKVALCVCERLHAEVQAALERRGFVVLTATSGAQALALLAAKAVDGVVLDYPMPGVNGAEVAAEIKRVHPATRVVLFAESRAGIPNRVFNLVDAYVEADEDEDALISELTRPREYTGEPLPPVRRFPRYSAQARLVLKVRRHGEMSRLQGLSTTISEGGIGARIDGELSPDELVSMEIADPLLATQLRPRAQVRYRNGDNYGFAFLGMSALQQADLRRFCRKLAPA